MDRPDDGRKGHGRLQRARNTELVRGLGAYEVLDYSRDDVAAEGSRYVVIFGAANVLPFQRRRRALRPGGAMVTVNPALDNAAARWLSRTVGGAPGRGSRPIQRRRAGDGGVLDPCRKSAAGDRTCLPSVRPRRGALLQWEQAGAVSSYSSPARNCPRTRHRPPRSRNPGRDDYRGHVQGIYGERRGGPTRWRSTRSW